MGVVSVIVVVLLFLGAGACFVLAYVAHRNNRARRALGPRPAPAPRPAPTRSPVRAHVPHALYVYYWADTGGDCYYGISNEPDVRDRRHSTDPRSQRWYPYSTKTMHILGWYPDKATAESAESSIIRRRALEGADLANDRHNPYARRRRAA